jgi:hypothetical protein
MSLRVPPDIETLDCVDGRVDHLGMLGLWPSAGSSTSMLDVRKTSSDDDDCIIVGGKRAIGVGVWGVWGTRGSMCHVMECRRDYDYKGLLIQPSYTCDP